MRFVVTWVLVFVSFLAVGAAPCEKESPPWVETVEIKDGCEAGKVLRFQCKDCTCDEDGKTASCPKWIKCCQKDEIWSTNACNICYCDGRYRRICKTVACLHRS